MVPPVGRSEKEPVQAEKLGKQTVCFPPDSALLSSLMQKWQSSLQLGKAWKPDPERD